MRLISHRGNLNGKNPRHENSPSYLGDARDAGYDIEMDVWLQYGKLYLGHDKPQYIMPDHILDECKSDHAWFHAKNLDALDMLVSNGLNCFWHENDKYTLTSKGFIWTYPNRLAKISEISVVLPDGVGYSDSQIEFVLANAFGICSDYVEEYNELLFRS